MLGFIAIRTGMLDWNCRKGDCGRDSVDTLCKLIDELRGIISTIIVLLNTLSPSGLCFLALRHA